MPIGEFKSPAEKEIPEGELTKAESPTDIKLWMDRKELCEKFCKAEFQDKNDRFLKYYAGDFWTNQSDMDRIAVNMVFPNTNIMVSSLYSGDPDVIFTPSKEIYEKGARILNSVYPWVLKKNKLKKHNQATLVDAALVGLGWTKTFWDKENNVPTSIRVSPFNVLIPPTAPGLYDMSLVPYIIHRIQKPLKDVRDNKNYKNSKALKGERSIKFTPDVAKLDAYKPDVDLVTLYEAHTREGKIITFAQGKELRTIDNPDNIKWSRFVPLFFYYIPDMVFPIALPSIYEPQQLEKNQIRTQMSKHRKRNVPKYIGRNGALTNEEVTRFESDEDASYFESKFGPEGIKPLALANTPGDTYNLEAKLDVDIDKETGISELARGVQGGGREQTATEANIINQNSSIRMNSMDGVVENFVTEEITRQTQLMQQYWTEEQSVKMMDAPEWINFTKDEIKGEYAVAVGVGSMKPKDRQSLKQEYGAVFNFILQAKQAEPLLQLKPIITKILSLYNIDPSSIYPPQQEILPPQGMVPQGSGEILPPPEMLLANPQQGAPSEGQVPKV